MSRRTKLQNKLTLPQSQCPALFVVAEAGCTVMFPYACVPLLIMHDGEIQPFDPSISTDEDQAEFVLAHMAVGKA